MIRKLAFILAAVLWLSLSACATIVHSGNRAIEIESTPPGATVSIFDRANVLVMNNTTPFVAHLDPKFGYFKGQSYRLVFEMKGHPNAETTISSSLSGWYFGNLLFGGLIGMLIVDPSTGAMFNLEPEKVALILSPSQAQVIRSHQGIMVMLTSDITAEERAQMVRVN